MYTWFSTGTLIFLLFRPRIRVFPEWITHGPRFHIIMGFFSCYFRNGDGGGLCCARAECRASTSYSTTQVSTVLYDPFKFYLTLLRELRKYVNVQCCGSGIIYSGSSFEFSEFQIRIQAKDPDPCGSGPGSNLY